MTRPLTQVLSRFLYGVSSKDLLTFAAAAFARRYAASFFGIADLLAIVPIYLSALYEMVVRGQLATGGGYNRDP